MKKISALALGLFLSISSLRADPPLLEIETLQERPALKVTFKGDTLTLVSAGDSEEEGYDLATSHFRSYPEGLPSKKSLFGWHQKRNIRRGNMTPFHLYKVMKGEETLGFIDFGQMPTANYSQGEFPVIVEKWQSLGVAQTELEGGKTQSVPGRGLATILPIFPTDMSEELAREALQTEAFKLAVQLMRHLAPYFSVDPSFKPEPKPLPEDWKQRLEWIKGKIEGVEEVKESPRFEESKDFMFVGEEQKLPLHLIGLFHPEDPLGPSLLKAGFTLDGDEGFHKFYDKPRALAHIQVLEK